jgi:23S rRNA (guanosine2251-2'-O)-methyltransferase
MKELIYSRNAVYEVLRARRRQVFRLLVAESSQEKGRLSEILQFAAQRNIPIERTPRARLDKIAANHQGVVLEASGYPYVALVDILDQARQRSEPPFLLVLDALQDPQNLATLLRTAEICGVHGAMLPLRQAAGVTPAVVNASSGASEHLLIAQANLAQAISEMKENDIWVAGLEGSPTSRPIASFSLDGPLALVVGSEGEGIRPLVRQSCDVLLRLEMRGQVESLNAAVAGSIALYLAMQARQGS